MQISSLKISKYVLLIISCGVLLIVGVSLLTISQNWFLRVCGSVLVLGSWSVSAAVFLRIGPRVHKSERTFPTELRRIERSISTLISDVRLKQSRHEYHQERSLERIEEGVRRLQVVAVDPIMSGYTPSIDVLFVTSNGAGLGHISRLLAVADQLDDGYSFELLTLSKAYRQVAEDGLVVHYFPSSEASGEAVGRWNLVFRDYFRGLVASRGPRVVVFDGTWVYQGLTDVCRGLGIPLVWVQRGMWREDVDLASPQRHSALSVADAVIIPGDYAGSERVELGSGIDPLYVSPIVRTTRGDLLDREDSARVLGLDPNGRYVLLNLGGGILGTLGSVVESVVRTVANCSPDLEVVQVVSPLSFDGTEYPGLRKVESYPVMQHCRAFEFAISAAGYNSAQEAVELGIPTILVPNQMTRTDDQVRRARQLADLGYVVAAMDTHELEDSIGRMCDSSFRDSIRLRLSEVESSNGASAAAAHIADVVDRTLSLRGVSL